MPLISFDDLLSSPPKKIPSLIGDGLLPPGGLMMVVGKTGIGKSVVALDMCMSLVLGEPLFKAFRKKNDKSKSEPYFPVHNPCKVLYFDAEIGHTGLYTRCMALRQSRCPGLLLERRLEFITNHPDTLSIATKSASNSLGLHNLKKLIVASKPEGDMPYVVVFDPLGNFHELDENDSSMRLVFTRVKELQAEIGFAAIFLHHESDRLVQGPLGPISRRGTQKSRGHSSVPQVMDTLVTLDRESDSDGIADLKLEWGKVRHAKTPSPGMLLCDYERMNIEWYGPCRGEELKQRLARRQEYCVQHGIVKDS